MFVEYFRPVFLAYILCLFPPFSLGETDHPPSDGENLAVFDQFNSLEIAVARAATERAQREDVRSHGLALVRDQEAQQREGRELGRKLRIFAPPQNEPGTYKQTISRLMAVPAEEFDRSYLKQQMAIERNAIDALTGGLSSVRNPELAKFLRTASEQYARHLQAAQALSASLGAE